MSNRGGRSHSEEAMLKKRESVIELGRQGVPVAEIVKAVKVTRQRVMEWLSSEGIEPTMLRRRTKAEGSVRNTPLALSIEEGVRKRIEQESRRGS